TETYHVIPIGDLREHVEREDECWCKPVMNWEAGGWLVWIVARVRKPMPMRSFTQITSKLASPSFLEKTCSSTSSLGTRRISWTMGGTARALRPFTSCSSSR